jgi:hypothetical protein
MVEAEDIEVTEIKVVIDSQIDEVEIGPKV